jgi:hypothetical protein
LLFAGKYYKFIKNQNRTMYIYFKINFRFPLFCLNLYLDFAVWNNFSAKTLAIVFLSFHLLAISTCTINPILYGLQNASFKEEFGKILTEAIQSMASNV